jgi:hypothetical protein
MEPHTDNSARLEDSNATAHLQIEGDPQANCSIDNSISKSKISASKNGEYEPNIVTVLNLEPCRENREYSKDRMSNYHGYSVELQDIANDRNSYDNELDSPRFAQTDIHQNEFQCEIKIVGDLSLENNLESPVFNHKGSDEYGGANAYDHSESDIGAQYHIGMEPEKSGQEPAKLEKAGFKPYLIISVICSGIFLGWCGYSIWVWVTENHWTQNGYDWKYLIPMTILIPIIF